ncbi:DEAD/DEAH box helicase [Rubritalea marina]|uniref:DEAD/DEAH box helicase n=1 Tax=Rubritalea marina TaxID=361055 RepID=UPI00037C3C2E|nr:DEAD/DEAH box helicase [Rubritalea marina]
MKIDEAWIRKAAGWKATKAGKELYERGSVIEVQQNGSIITGALQGGGAKPTRVTVRIHSDTDIDVVCPKPACRRRAEICRCAVAVMFASVLGIREKVSTVVASSGGSSRPSGAPRRSPERLEALPEGVPVPRIGVEFSPKFPEGLPDGGLSMRLQELQGEDVLESEADRRFAAWLLKHAGGQIPPMMSLKGERALEFLASLAGHGRLSFGGRRMQVSADGVRLPVYLELDGDRVKLSLDPSLEQHGRVWFSAGRIWMWEADQAVLLVVPTQSCLTERLWQALTLQGAVFLPVQQLVQQLDRLEAVVHWQEPTQLQQIPIRQKSPQIRLEMFGDTHKLKARLIACYSEAAEVVLGIFGHAQAEFPVADPDEAGAWIERSVDAEDAAAGRLMSCGFQLNGSQGDWVLDGTDAVVEFLSGAMQQLEEEWHVVTAGKLRTVKGNLVRVKPTFKLEGSGQDWLAFDYGFVTDEGREIPREAIEKMLRSGKRTATSKNGKQVVISDFDAEIVESVLRDTDPRQEGGKYYVPKNQGAYLKRLKAYYAGESQSLEVDQQLLQKLPQKVATSMRVYQREGVTWLHQRCVEDGAALLADDMGLGKTLQTLSVLELLQKPGHPSMVVCPRSLLANWASEAAQWTPGLKVLVMHGAKRHEHFDSIEQYDLVITSYSLVAKDLKQYQERQWNALVIDEASIIRNPNTQNAKALRKVQSDYRVALTGTPVENAVRDMWSLFAFLMPGYLGTQEDFAQRYEAKLAGGQSDPSALRRLRLRTAPFMIRRTKSEVAKDLPKKLEQVLWCEPSKLQKEAYQELLKKGAERVSEAEGGAARMRMLTTLLRLRQASCDLRLLGDEGMLKHGIDSVSSKLVMLLDLLEEAKRGGHRVLVFSQFTQALKLIRQSLEEAGLSIAYLDGSTHNRGAEVERFQRADGPDVFLISLKAGGYGLNLTAADTVVHFDPWWNPAVEAQATDRAYRIGQTKPVTVYKLIAQGTVEEKILKLQEQKRGVIGAAVGDESQPMMNGLSEEDLRGLLSV